MMRRSCPRAYEAAVRGARRLIATIVVSATVVSASVATASLTAALLLTAGCSSDVTATGNPVAGITLTPSTATVTAGTTLPLQATLVDSGGATVTGPAIVWSSSNTSVASVSRAGVVTALAQGEARIAASAFGRSATATITVTARPVASVSVTPAAVSMQVGVSAPLQARALDAEGAVLSGRTVTWTSSDPGIAIVNAQGAVTGVAPGAATITATCEGRSAQAAVTVTLPPVASIVVSPAVDTLGVGTERQLGALVRDANNQPLTGRTLSWSSSNLAIASVSSTGLITGLATGTTTVTATSEGRTGTATIVVLARLASTVVLTPGSGTLVVGASQPLTAQVTDAEGNLLPDRPVSYTSDAPDVAAVSASGVVTALTPGTARITASSEGKSGTATFRVIPVPVASVELTPSVVSLRPGGNQQLVAVPRSADGVILTGRAVTWISGAPGIATVDGEGRVSAVGNGIAVILAIIDNVAASAVVTVAPPAVASITLAPAEPSLSVGSAVQLTATLRDAEGTALSGRTITWSSADESIAFVSSTGQVVGFKLGTVRITATSEGVSASISVTVR
jgi:trimeric autotransporter adhesin